jgi:hypothetical protein
VIFCYTYVKQASNNMDYKDERFSVLGEIFNMNDTDRLVISLIERVNDGRIAKESLFDIVENPTIVDDFRMTALDVLTCVDLTNEEDKRACDCVQDFLKSTSTELQFFGVACFPELSEASKECVFPIIKELSETATDHSTQRAAKVVVEWYV